MADQLASSTTNLRYIQAVNHALDRVLSDRDDTLIFGEDVAIPGGPFGATKGLYKKYGIERVFDTPISESGMLGMALGSAMTGLRPIVEIMYADFMFVAMDQLVNQIANTRYSSGGRWTAPLVIRTQQGWSPGACAQHAQSIETYLTHTPGLRVAVPYTPEDAFNMIRTAVSVDDPVVVVEHRMLYPSRGEVDLDAEIQDMGGAAIRRQGDDVTLVSWGRGVDLCLEAAAELEQEGISSDVIDMRWLAPLDLDTVAESLGRTGSLVVVHEANLTCGVGSEIVASMLERDPRLLRNGARRVGMPGVPMPAAPSLQNAVLPNAGSVSSAVRSMKS